MNVKPANTPDWVAADWGTSHLRLWMMAENGQVLQRLHSAAGMGTLTSEGYEPELLRLLEGALPAEGALDVICCGMAGAAQGWAEAPYAAAPCPPPGPAEVVQPALETPRLRVFILPGVKQMAEPDVMRGEETQIAGFLAAHPGYDGMLCLPGTHSKWARVRDGTIEGFRTFMTGELFALLSSQSVLRHTTNSDGWDEAAFEAAVSDIMAAPADLTGKLFGLRAGPLLTGMPPETARARLSGLLIGAELAATRKDWQALPVALIGENSLAQAYAEALALKGHAPTLVNTEDMTLGGLKAARRQLQG